MDINKQIIDQRIRKIVEENPTWFEDLTDPNPEKATQKKMSRAFLILGVSAYLQIELPESEAIRTDAGNDAGVDAIEIGDTVDYEFNVTIFQSKYTFNLDKDSNFPANSILRIVDAIKNIFDPNSTLLLNNRIKPKVEEIRSLILDGYIPIIKCICFNNGLNWNQEGNDHINNSKFPKNQVVFDFFNHNQIIKQLQNINEIKDTISLSGKAVIEEFAFKRVLIGKLSVQEVANLMTTHGDALLEKNIRRYLGLNKNRVNEGIRKTLIERSRRNNFYFFNNGITMICKKFSHNALMSENWQVRVEDVQIINGGQTAKTILQTVSDNPNEDFSNATVLLRLYEISSDDDASVDLTTDITIATNSQTPVDLRDLRANDSIQKNLGNSIAELNYSYKTKKGLVSNIAAADGIPSSVAAEAIFSIWKRKPHLAKFKRSELFGKFYEDVFKDINGAQTVIAVTIFRFSDSLRKRDLFLNQFPHLPYSTYFLSMLMGDYLLERHQLNSYIKIDHVNFDKIKKDFDDNRDHIFEKANLKLSSALNKLYPDGYTLVDLRRLAASFRRGDLLSIIEN